MNNQIFEVSYEDRGKVCCICGESVYKVRSVIGRHLKNKHNMTKKEYYDTYFFREMDGACLNCNLPTKWVDDFFIYRTHCSISCSVSSQWKNHDFQTMMSNKTSMQVSEYWKNEEYRKAQSERMSKISTEQWNNSEHREMMSNAMSKCLTERWKIPEFREMRLDVSSKVMNKNWENPEFREKMATVMKNLWEDSNHREKMLKVSSKTLSDLWKCSEYRNKMCSILSERASNQLKDSTNMFSNRKGNKAIYNGVNYRSSWEVNLAKSLDDLGIDHVYEFETFILPDGIHRYTPDFYLPQLNLVIEVKPEYFITDSVVMKMEHLKSFGYETMILSEKNWDEFISSKSLSIATA